jgi:hypothetical protein
VIVPKVAGPYPILKGTEKQEVRNIVIRKDALVTVTQSSILQVRGTIYSNMANYIFGTLDGTDGKIELNGASPHTYVGVDTPQTIAGSLFKMRTLKDLQISNPLNAYVRPTPNDTLNITGALSFGAVNNSTLYTGDNITLISLSAQTARVADITNNGSNSGNNFVGDVIVERYINSGTGPTEHGKGWIFLATPTTGQTVRQSWMENGKMTATGFGTQITGTGGTAAGFDLFSQSPSMKYYNSKGPALGTDWLGISSPGIPIYNPNGYMLFVRGDRSIPGPFTPAIPTRLRTKGKLFAYKVTVPVEASGFSSIGNPYASSIDMAKVISESPGLDPFFTVWDSPAYGSFGYGAYVTYSVSGSGFVATPGGEVSKAVQSGQAFFVQSSGAGTNIVFNETSKLAGSSSSIFRAQGGAGKTIQLRTNLYGISNTGKYLADGTLHEFGDDLNSAIDGNDAKKLLNSGENFAIISGQQKLIIERRKIPNEKDTLFFNFIGAAKQPYRFEFVTKGLSHTGLETFLEDTYLKTSTPILPEDTTIINFMVDNTKESAAANRFYIIFKRTVVLPVLVTFGAQPKDRTAEVVWNVENEKNMDHYEVERSTDGNLYTSLYSMTANNTDTSNYKWADKSLLPATYYYRIKSVDQKGKITYTQPVTVLIGDGKPSIAIYPNPITNGIIHLQMLNLPAGNYGIRLMNQSGQVFISKQVERIEGSNTETVNWDYRLARGVYHLEITKPDGTRKIIKVVY